MSNQAYELMQEKAIRLREACAPLIGCTIQRYETAEIQYIDGTWADWPDLPIRIYCSDQKLLSVAWSRFDDLWLSQDTSLPFAVEDASTRWKSNGIESINAAIGRQIYGVWLGRGSMTIESQEIEIWTRLLFDLGESWLEVVNALDENGYELHPTQPVGDFRKCV